MASLVTYTLAAAVVNSFTYGILAILFVVSMLLLGRQNNASPLKTSHSSVYLKPVVLASILLFAVVTAHWVVVIRRLFEAFGNPTRNPEQVVGDILSPFNITEIALVFVSGALGDYIIIYRLWMIWGRHRLVAIFPTCSAIGQCASFVGLIYQLINAGTYDAAFFSSWNHWIIGACVFTLCTNIYCSGLIMWRLLVNRPKNVGIGGDRIVCAAVIAIESAALYTSWATFFFTSYEADMGVYLFAGTVWPPITGIAIMLINVRVGLSHIRKSNLIPTSQLSVGWKFDHPDSDLSSHSININITRTVDVDDGSSMPSTEEPSDPSHL